MADPLHTEPLAPPEYAATRDVPDRPDLPIDPLQMPGGVDPFDEDLGLMSTRQLRILVNRAFRALESSNPPYGARHRYDAVLEEIDHRARQAVRRGRDPLTRSSFRDNVLYQRFELRIDGTLAAHLRYRLRAGRISLVEGMEYAAFRDQGVDTILLRQVLLNTHRRRLSVVPQCPMVLAFLADNPQYRGLTAASTIPRAPGTSQDVPRPDARVV